jgi:hypothetical protein
MATTSYLRHGGAMDKRRGGSPIFFDRTPSISGPNSEHAAAGGWKGSAPSQRVPHGTIVTLELPYQKPVYEGAVYPSYFDAPSDSSYH